MSGSARVARLEAKSFLLDELLSEVRAGRVRIPDFQRGFRWRDRDVTQLFDSIYRGYPIGTLLFWKRSAPAGPVRLAGIELPAPPMLDAWYVVDGQQRIASLALALSHELGSLSNERRFNVHFNPDTEEFRTFVPGKAAADPWLPISTAFSFDDVLAWTAERAMDAGEARTRVFELTRRLRDVRVPAYMVETEDEGAVRQVFDRMNTFGQRMKRSEVFDALHGTGEAAQQSTRLSYVGAGAVAAGFGRIDDQQLMYAVLATRGPDVTREFRAEFDSDDERVAAYENGRAALDRAVAFMRNQADVPHARLIPHQHLLVALVRFLHLHPAPSPRNEVLLRRWFWRSAVLGPQLKGGTTGTLRQVPQAVRGADEYQDVSALLALAAPPTEAEPPAPRAGAVRLSNADARIVLAAMFSLKPLTLRDASPVAADDLFGDDRTPLPKLIESGLDENAKSMANRLLVVDDELLERPAIDVLADAVANGDALATSHVVDRTLADFVRLENWDDALAHRADAINDVVQRFVASRAEWSMSDRPSIEELLSDAAR